MQIGQKLKNKRVEEGLSQEALAERIGVSRQTISSWENNRTYPDIGSILKLSDLYGVSLDELLKEDENMRKHVEESAKLTTRYLNILFEAAILLLPIGYLVAWWGLPLVGLTMQCLGLLMLPCLWFARWRLRQMPKKDLHRSLIGWGLILAAMLVRTFWHSDLTLQLASSVLHILGLLLIYAYGVRLERGKRFWLVIALYFGIPIYIFCSGWLSTFEDMGAFSEADPFGRTYCIGEVLVGEETQASVELELMLSQAYLTIDGGRIGEFQYQEPTENQTEQGIWLLTPENALGEQYKLVVDGQGSVLLSLLVDDQLQWRWRLTELPEVWYHAETAQSSSSSELLWYPDWSGDPTELPWLSVYGPAEAYLTCSDDSVTTMTVTASHHSGGNVETAEYVLERDGKNRFPLPDPMETAEKGAYIVYQLTLGEGIYLLRVELR